MVQLVLMIVLLLCSSGVGLALQVTVPATTTVHGAQINLADVARLNPPIPALNAKRIKRSPAPGKQLKVSRDQIKHVLVQNGVAAEQIKFVGASTVQVVRDSIIVSASDIKREIDTYLIKVQRKLPYAHFKFTPQLRNKKFVLPAGGLRVEVIPSVAQVVGSRHFTLIYKVDGRTVKNLSVSGKLEVLADVVVAQRNLRRGEIIDRQDVALASLDISKIKQPLFYINDVIGKKVIRNIRSAQVVQEKNIDFPPLVKKGAFVKIIARRGGLLLTATGIAKQDGKLDDAIRVRNSASQKDITAKVVGADQVEVGF